MDTKKCRRCGEELTLDMFYKHSQMADGHLNICIECVKARVNKHRVENVERIRAYDRERSKLPHRIKKRREITKRRRLATGYDKVHSSVENAIKKGKCVKSMICQACGANSERLEAHHYDYSKPLDVIWLCLPCHRQYHTGKSERAKMVKVVVDAIADIRTLDLSNS